MSVASLVLATLSGVTTLFGLVPCLGWLNWFGIPISVAAVAMGVVGLVADKDPTTREGRNQNVHLIALVGGLICIGVGAIRCTLGGGFF